MSPLVDRRILLGKDLVVLYGAVPEFLVAVDDADRVIGYGAAPVMSERRGEVRTLGVSEQRWGRGIAHQLPAAIEQRALDLGLIDGLGDIRTILRARYGEKVSLRMIAPSRPGLVARLLGRRSFGDDTLLDPAELLGTLEERAAWTRLGL